MKFSTLSSAAVVALSAVTAPAMAQEIGRVISSTPVVQQVGVPRQVCTVQPMAYGAPPTGAGAVIGAIAGGGLGSVIGQGSGNALATAAGVIGGAIIGNNVESASSQVQNVQQCSTQTFYENRTVGYNIVYEYGGKQYSAQLPNDPGPTVQIQVSPVGALAGAPPEAAAPGGGQAAIYGQPQYQPGVAAGTYVAPVYAPYYAPVAVYPGAYGYYGGYYPRVGVSLGWGYRYGGGYRGGRHR